MCVAFTRALLAIPSSLYKIINYIFLADGTTNPAFLQSAGVGNTVVLTPGMIIWDAAQAEDEWTAVSGIKGRLACNGQSVLRADYAALFTKIDISFGSVDATHFNVPDLRGRTAVGVGAGTDDQPVPENRTIAHAESDGEFKHTLLRVELPADMFGSKATAGNVTDVLAKVDGGAASQLGGAAGDWAARSWQGASTPMNNMPPFLGLRSYIKT